VSLRRLVFGAGFYIRNGPIFVERRGYETAIPQVGVLLSGKIAERRRPREVVVVGFLRAIPAKLVMVLVFGIFSGRAYDMTTGSIRRVAKTDINWDVR
jgi:hypothetical protein